MTPDTLMLECDGPVCSGVACVIDDILCLCSEQGCGCPITSKTERHGGEFLSIHM